MTDSLREKILTQYEKFPKQEKKVAKYIIDNYSNILAQSSKELAQITGVSNATVVRFSKTLGYNGFLEFRAALKKEGIASKRPYNLFKSTNISLDSRDLDNYYSSMEIDIHNFTSGLDYKMLEELAKKILEAETVYLFGIGTDKIVMDYLNQYFPLLGIRTIILKDEGLALKDKVLYMSNKDFLFMSSYPTVQPDEYWIYNLAKKTGTPVFLLTDSDVTAKTFSADRYLVTRGTTETFINSSILSIYFCDLLLLKLRETEPNRADEYMKKYDRITSQKR